MRFLLLIPGLVLFINTGCAQKPEPAGLCIDPAFDQKVNSLISFSVPTIGVKELKEIKDQVVIFDTRELPEYEVSHIENAKYLGYKDFDKTQLNDIPKDAKIVLYCSVGYRSEKIGERLHDLGYGNVYNLYGSIFEWVNQDNPVVDKNGNIVNKVHTYNKQWSKWVDGQKIEKIW